MMHNLLNLETVAKASQSEYKESGDLSKALANCYNNV